MKLFTIKGWKFILTLSLKQDLDCYDDFHLSMTLRNCYVIQDSKRTDKKYFIFELDSRRLFELRLEKESHVERNERNARAAKQA